MNITLFILSQNVHTFKSDNFTLCYINNDNDMFASIGMDCWSHVYLKHLQFAQNDL